jgi:hypothetical protein
MSFVAALGAVVLSAFCATPAMAANKYPFMVQSPLNVATPFTVTLPSATDEGKSAKTVAIDFVTADCDATAGTPSLGSAQITVQFQGQNGFYHLPFQPGMMFPNAAEFVLAQETQMFADGGSSVSFGMSADSANCTVVFSGHLLTK